MNEVLIIATDIPDEERHSFFWHFLDNKCGGVPTSNSCELDVSTWGDVAWSEWNDQLAYHEDELDSNEDTIAIWHIKSGGISRMQLGMNSTFERD